MAQETLKLFPYQVTGARFLSERKYAYLADRQRLGKTVQSIAAADLTDALRILVVCRSVAKSQWAAEFLRWTKKPRHISVRNGIVAGNFQFLPTTGVVILSYESVTPFLAKYRGALDLAIIDEAHAVKNGNAKRTQAVLGKNGLIHRTKRMWFLSGTPVPNHFAELWPVFYAIGKTPLFFINFAKEYCNTYRSTFGLQILGTKTDPATLEKIRNLNDDFLLRRTEEDVDLELPKVFKTEIQLIPGKVDVQSCFPAELEEYGLNGLLDLIEKELGILKSITQDGMASDQLIEALKAQAKSVSTTRRYTALQKLDPFCELIREELEAKHFDKVVIFCIHRDVSDALFARFSDFRPAMVRGGTRNPADEVARFQDPNSGCRIFIGNIQSAGTSISLTSANHIYFFELSWVPGENLQAEMRCGGVNQKKHVFVKTVYLENSVDQRIAKALLQKMNEQKLIFNEGEKKNETRT